jgi:hypothetical protein
MVADSTICRCHCPIGGGPEHEQIESRVYVQAMRANFLRPLLHRPPQFLAAADGQPVVMNDAPNLQCCYCDEAKCIRCSFSRSLLAKFIFGILEFMWNSLKCYILSAFWSFSYPNLGFCAKFTQN